MAYRDGMSTQQIIKELGIGWPLIKDIFRRHDIQTRSRGCGSIKSVREDAFDTITEESAYWVGFLMADGCVSHRTKESKRISLALQDKDADHIEKFKKFLGFYGATIIGKRKTGDSVAVYVSSNRLANALARYGVTERKSHTVRVVGLEDNRDFWRGVVDGDGSVLVRSRKRDGYQLPIVQLAGSGQLVNQFREFSETIVGPLRAQVRPNKNIFAIDFAGFAACEIARKLYESCSISLARKQAVADRIIAEFGLRFSAGRNRSLLR